MIIHKIPTSPAPKGEPIYKSLSFGVPGSTPGKTIPTFFPLARSGYLFNLYIDIENPRIIAIIPINITKFIDGSFYFIGQESPTVVDWPAPPPKESPPNKSLSSSELVVPPADKPIPMFVVADPVADILILSTGLPVVRPMKMLALNSAPA